ncbi:MAG: DUF1552 domain-containing protein [Planctomycetota bacterium]
MSKSRRQFIKGIALGAGAATLAPLLARIKAHADGDEKAMPRRFVFVIKSSGLPSAGIRPIGLDVGDGSRKIDLPLKNYALPETLKALEPFKDQTLILDGLSGVNFTGNHSAYYGALSCHHAPEKPVAPSIDCLLGKLFPAPFENYGFAPNGHAIGSNAGPTVANGAVFPRISAYGQNQPMAFQASAEKAYRQLFGSALELSTGGQKEFALQTNLLDFLADDTRRVAKQVAAEEREKLDSYLAAFESVRARNIKLDEMKPRIKQNAPQLTTQYASNDFCERIKTFFELAAATLVTGLSNVISIRMDWLSVKYEALGFKTTSVHDIGHGAATDNGFSAAQATDAIRAFQVEQIAGLAARLQAIPEGNGTMLDNTLIVYLSDNGEAHHGTHHEWPFIVVGGKRMKLKTAGRYLRYPNYGKNGHKTIGNWYNTILHASGGKSQPYFGQVDASLGDIDLKGPLTELLV